MLYYYRITDYLQRSAEVKSVKEEFLRTAAVLGNEAIKTLAEKRVAVFGVGGVGGYAAEALARSGVGHITLVDFDTVSLSNINRQIIALHSTVGRPKTEVMRKRIADINPDCEVKEINCFFDEKSAERFDFKKYDYVIDAIDSVKGKTELAVCCKNADTPLISAMGAGNKLDPTAFRVADIYDTKVCPLARIMRRELKLRGVEKLKVVYSEETPVPPSFGDDGRPTVGSLPFVPSVMGLIMAGEVIKGLCRKERDG